MRILAVILLASSCYGAYITDPYGPTPTVDWIQFDLLWEDGVAEGRLQWNNDDGVLEVGLPGSDVTLQIGLEELARVTNKTGSTITNGTPVYITGAQGSRPTVGLANASDTNKYMACGVATEDIAHNKNGYVTTFGYVRNTDTSAWTAGDRLYLSDTDGGLTNGVPAYPSEPMCVAIVLFSSAEDGILLVRPSLHITFEMLRTTDLKVGTLELTDTNVYQDLRFPVESTKVGAQAPDPVVVSNCIYTLAFDDNLGEFIYFTAQMSHSYRNGTELEPHIHWISNGLNTTSVWELVYSKAPIDGVFSASVATTNTIVSDGPAGTHEISDLDNIPGFDTGVSGMIGCKLTRIAGGTTEDIKVTEVDIHYKVQYIGGKDYHN